MTPRVFENPLHSREPQGKLFFCKMEINPDVAH